jgi:hypothetical protein
MFRLHASVARGKGCEFSFQGLGFECLGLGIFQFREFRSRVGFV